MFYSLKFEGSDKSSILVKVRITKQNWLIIFLFYADGEAFNTIPNNILGKIRNVVNVRGMHECFNSFDTSKLFFDTLLPYLD